MSYFSNHIFMFPFSLKGCGGIMDIRKSLVATGWKHDRFEYRNGDYAENFSLQAYFYEFAIGALVDDGTPNSVIESYSKDIGKNAKYIIDVLKTDLRDACSYELHIDKISLDLYDGKVAILSFHLENHKYSDFKDVLAINDFGRRIYPLYFSLDKDGEVDLTEVKQRVMADGITIDIDCGGQVFSDDFTRYLVQNEHPFVLPDYITGLLPKCLHCVHWLQDERMFVISWYGNDEISSTMNLPFTIPALEAAYSEKGDSFGHYSNWYRFLYVYKGHKPYNSQSRFALQLKSSTYDRWAEDGCLYGVTRFSFVALTDENGFYKGRRYMKSMYYRMASLCLAQRTMVLYFANEITELTSMLNEPKKHASEIFDDVKRLNLDFIRFKNNLYFREVTTQTQGIELYNMMQQQMEIEADVKELKSEIEQLYQYVNMDGDQRRTKDAQALNLMAVVLLPLTIVIGFFSMNDFNEIVFSPGSWIELAIGIILCAAGFFLYKKTKR